MFRRLSRSEPLSPNGVLSMTLHRTRAQTHIQELEIKLGGTANIVTLNDQELSLMTQTERTEYRLRVAVARTRRNMTEFLDTLDQLFEKCNGSHDDFSSWRQGFIDLVEAGREPDFNYMWKDNWVEIKGLLAEMMKFVKDKTRTVQAFVKKFPLSHLTEEFRYQIQVCQALTLVCYRQQLINTRQSTGSCESSPIAFWNSVPPHRKEICTSCSAGSADCPLVAR